MPEKLHGTASAFQNLTEYIHYYTVFAKSPKSFTDPENATLVDIRVTKNCCDISQKNFEVLLMSIALRAMPVIMNDPIAVQYLDRSGAPTIYGEGYIWRFAIEREDYFYNFSDIGTPGPIGLLIDELNGIVLPNETVLKTKGIDKNIEFIRHELWHSEAETEQADVEYVPDVETRQCAIQYARGKKGK